MKALKIIASIIIILPILFVGIFFVWPRQSHVPDTSFDFLINASPSPFNTHSNWFILPKDKPTDIKTTTHLSQPTIDFQARVTKKPFGIHVTPKDSPISPERFSGWHTGSDAEYEDTENEIEVHAISNGIVRSARRANGYGGIVVIEHTINNQALLAIYGHLDPTSLIQENSQVTVGQKIGILGQGKTTETDMERKHLHFGILSNTKLDIRGYVDSIDELDKWLDPLTFFTPSSPAQ